MSYIVVDVEADGPIHGEHSMVCFGAVLIDPEHKLDKTFYGAMHPISPNYIPEALAVSGFTREEHMKFDNPHVVIKEFETWLKINSKGHPVLLSDNNQFDGGWMNYYFHRYLGKNPFGFSSRRIGDMFAGFYKDSRYRWKKHRITKHTHNPVDDARGNAEAVIYLLNQGYKMPLK